MAKNETTLDSLDALEIDSVSTAVEPQPEPLAEADSPAKPEASEPDPPQAKDKEASSFIDAMQASLSGDSDKPEEPEEPEVKEPEVKEADNNPTAAVNESRSSSDFKKLKEDRDNARREIDELKRKLEEKQSDDVTGMLASVKEERDLLSNQLKLAQIERHPSFQREFQAKITSVVDQARKLVPEEQADRVAELMQMNESDYRSNGLEEVMIDLSTTKQAKMGALLARIDEVREDRENALKDADSTYQRLIKSENESRESQLAETNKVFDQVSQRAVQSLELLQQRDGDDEWNSEVAARLETARNIFSGDSTAEKLAEASHWAAVGPKYRTLLGEAIEVNRRLREENKKLAGATPSVTGGNVSNSSKPSENKSFIDLVTESIGQ